MPAAVSTQARCPAGPVLSVQPERQPAPGHSSASVHGAPSQAKTGHSNILSNKEMHTNAPLENRMGAANVVRRTPWCRHGDPIVSTPALRGTPWPPLGASMAGKAYALDTQSRCQIKVSRLDLAVSRCSWTQSKRRGTPEVQTESPPGAEGPWTPLDSGIRPARETLGVHSRTASRRAERLFSASDRLLVRPLTRLSLDVSGVDCPGRCPGGDSRRWRPRRHTGRRSRGKSRGAPAGRPL